MRKCRGSKARKHTAYSTILRGQGRVAANTTNFFHGDKQIAWEGSKEGGVIKISS